MGTDMQREEWQRERDEWKENRAVVAVIEERHIGIYVDAQSHSASSRADCMLECTTPFPILALNLPVALASCSCPCS